MSPSHRSQNLRLTTTLFALFCSFCERETAEPTRPIAPVDMEPIAEGGIAIPQSATVTFHVKKKRLLTIFLLVIMQAPAHPTLTEADIDRTAQSLPPPGAMVAMDDVLEGEEEEEEEEEAMGAEDEFPDQQPMMDFPLEEDKTVELAPATTVDDDDEMMLGRSLPIDIPMMLTKKAAPPAPEENDTIDNAPVDFQPPHSLATGDEFSAREKQSGRIKSDGTLTYSR